MARTLLSAFMLLLALPVSAQEALPADLAPINIPEVVSPLNCFDYYTFGSVQANLQPTVTQTVPGSTLTFTGAVWNANSYPILDGTLYVKIFRKNDTTFAQGDGNEVVDQFIIKEGMTVSASSTIALQYEWDVPVNAQGGEYYAAYFFTTAKKYNLLGLSFTDDEVGNPAPFTVTAENDIAKLSKADTTINEQNYQFSSTPLHLPAGETVVIKTTITNPTSESKNLPLQWNQYAWGAMDEDNLRFTKTEVVNLAPNETKEVTYEIQAQRESVVYVIAVTQDNEAKSILNIRYVRDGIEETRINFSGLTTFPLAKDTPQTFLACAHSTNMPVVPGNTLTLTLKDKTGAVIHEYKYEGDISIVGGGFGETFTPVKNINFATLTATLERNGVMVEQVTQTYDCTVIDPNSCLPEDVEAASLSDYFKTHLMNILLIGVLALLVIVVAIFLIRKRRNHIDGNTTKMTTPLALLFFIALGMFYGVESVSAQYTWGFTSDANGPITASRPAGTSAPSNPYAGWYVDGLIGVNAASSLGLSQAEFDRFANLARGAHAGTRFIAEPHPGDPSKYYWVGKLVSPGLFGGPLGNIVSMEPIPSSDNFMVCSSGLGFGGWTTSGNNGSNTGTGSGSGSCEVMSTGPTASITANPNNIDLGDTTRLTWTSENADYCYIQGFNENNVFLGDSDSFYFLAPSGWVDASPTVNTRYRLGCSKVFGGSVTDDVTVTINNAIVNTAPNTPTLTNCSMNGVVNTSYNFGMTATDGDGDTLKYGVDWDNNGSVDEWVPGTGYVNSGTSQTASRSWTTAGTYTFAVLSQDSKGANSGWASCGATIATAPAPTADLTINGSNGPINVAKNATVNLNWTSANAASCTKWGGNWGSGETISTPGSGTTIVTVTTTYMINCGGTTDTVTVNVVNQTPTAPTITYTSGTRETSSNVTFSIQGSDLDGDNVFYEVDWDMDNVTDATTMTVPSNTTQPATYSWSTDGVKTFQARTVDTVGARSPWTSHQVTIAVTSSPPGQPNAPALITTACDVNQITVTWVSVSGATSYDLQYQTSPSGAWQLLTDVNSPRTLTGLTAGATYNVQVRAKNVAGNSAWSGYGTAMVPAECGWNAIATITASNCQIPVGDSSCTTNVTWTSTDTIPSVSVRQAGDQFSTAANESTPQTRTLPYGLNTFTFSHKSGTQIASYDVTASCASGAAWDSVSTTCLPDPQLDLSADPIRVKSGQPTTLTWSVGNVYSLTCTVRGPGLPTSPVISFNPSIDGPSDGSPYTIGAITAKSTYTLTCTSGTASFSDTVTVESQGVIEEI